MQIGESEMLQTLIQQPETFTPQGVLEALGASPESSEGRAYRVAFGSMLEDFDHRGLVEWNVDPVSGSKTWRLTAEGRALAEAKRAS